MAAAAAAADHSLDSAARHGEQAQAGAAGGSGALLYHPFGRLSEDKCHSRDNTEMAGGVVGWGPTNKQPTAAACCQSCAAHNEKAASGGGGGDAAACPCTIRLTVLNETSSDARKFKLLALMSGFYTGTIVGDAVTWAANFGIM